MSPANLPPPTVKRALVHATSVLTTRDQERVLSVDMRPLVIHLLAGLEQAGIERAVVTLGHDAAKVAECVTAYGFTHMQIDFVYLTLGSAVGALWRNLANSVIAARAAFTGSAPLLIVRADNLYDFRLLRKIAEAPFGRTAFGGGKRRYEAYALADTTPAVLAWARGAKPENWARIALAEHDRGRAIRCGPQLGSFDAIVAGEVYACTPNIFELLAGLFSQSLSTSLADAVAELADRGVLGVVEVGELDCHWFASRTLASIFTPGAATTAAAAAAAAGSSSSRGFAHVFHAAQELLYSGEWRPTANMPERPQRGELERKTEPLLQLGSTLGEGANGVVVEGMADGEDSGVPGGRLAVKMFRPKAHLSDLEARASMEAVMAEVHAMRQLRGHPHIVQLKDVVELADAVYIVMERIEGPDLQDLIRRQPGGRLAERHARLYFRQILAALRHAHARGLLHCDLKPANVRLHERPDGSYQAVVVDWGLARRLSGKQPASLMMGTPAYASPEQLTGYNADQAWGRARLGPPADVWALGATLYEMLAGFPPFGGDSHEALAANALALNYDARPDVLGGNVRAAQLVDSMLQVLPSDRAVLHELCADPWTVADGAGPMPPEEPPTDSVFVDCERGGDGGIPKSGSGGSLPGGSRQASPMLAATPGLAGLAGSVKSSGLCPSWAQKMLLYVGYGVLVCGALLFSRRQAET